MNKKLVNYTMNHEIKNEHVLAKLKLLQCIITKNPGSKWHSWLLFGENTNTSAKGYIV